MIPARAKQKPRAGRNQTIAISAKDTKRLKPRLCAVTAQTPLRDCVGKTIQGDAFEVLPLLPEKSVDLLIADPPYNLAKSFNGSRFAKRSDEDYAQWLDGWCQLARRVLKPSASVYICSDWQSSAMVYQVAGKYFNVMNRITWEREKGRGSLHNWKNCSEDIWFCTVSDDYHFDVDAVKIRRRVIAPYRDAGGRPKDWEQSEDGNFRVTHPSNLWTDISVPFWSMPENTEHPTQKPEKLIAKLILASSKPCDVVLDPFLGSGTTSVVAKKLGRQYIGIEKEEKYCLLAERRLEMADSDTGIQGYAGGHFWERNSLRLQKKG